MIKILIYAIVVLALGYGFSWLADRPGDLTIVWQSQQIEMSLMVATTIIVSLIAAVMIIWWLVRTIWTSPRSLNRYFRARKRDRGYQALSTGLIAASAGDAATARKMNARAKGLLRADQEPMILLLEAQACLIEGRNDEARRKFEEMANDPETRELGLRGLYLEAKRLGADEAASQYAEKAAEKAPHLPWAAEATLETKTKLGLFDEALKLLDEHRLSGAIGKEEANRKKAVLMTARAASKLESDPKAASDDAQQAIRLASEFVPAGLVAAKALYRENNQRKASAILERIWKVEPHPDIAVTFINAQGGLAAAERLKRAQRLEAYHPSAFESLFAVASAALDAREYTLAREKAEAAARADMRESVFLLLADIEEAETGDQARVRHWMTLARRAPQDPAWIADGFVSHTWLPLSPVTGRLDAFEWKKIELAQGALVAHEPLDANEAFLSLPPIEIVPEEETEPVAAEQKPEPEASPEVKSEPTQVQPEMTGKFFTEEVVAAAAPSVESKKKEPEATGKVKEKEAEEALPFFGHPPDDPGVKPATDPDEGKTRLKLF
jgi:HemY protein